MIYSENDISLCDLVKVFLFPFNGDVVLIIPYLLFK